MSWRRNAFRVEDFLTPTAQMRFKFIASDSLRPEVNLSGGSLVEAAMDDFTLFDEYVPQAMDEVERENWRIYPSLITQDYSRINIESPLLQSVNNIQIINSTGSVINNWETFDRNSAVIRIDLGEMSNGYYLLKINGEMGSQVSPIIIVK
jgi:hypothetical protein